MTRAIKPENATAKPRRGRPPLPDGQVRGIMFTVRLATSEMQALDDMAKAANMTPSMWARAVLGKPTIENLRSLMMWVLREKTHAEREEVIGGMLLESDKAP